MLKKRVQLKDISAVAASRTAVINCPVGPRYHGVVLTTGDSAASGTGAPANSAIINEIRCLLGGKIVRRMTAARLDAINTGMGAKFASLAVAGASGNGLGRRYIPIFFGEPWRKRMADQDALAWQTGWLGPTGRFQIECDLLASITPVLSAYAIVDNFQGTGNPHAIMKWLTNDFNAVGTPIEIATLERKDYWSQLSIFDTSDSKSVTRARLVAGDLELHDLTVDENTEFLNSVDMNPASGRYDIVFDHDDSLDDLVPAGDLPSAQLTLTLSAAASGTVSIVTQRVGVPS